VVKKMEAKFTKGEWLVRVGSDDAKVYYPHGFLTSASVIRIDESRLDGESWIDMRDRTKSARDKAKVESNANMYLIASAPEMYSILNDAMVKLSFGDYESELIAKDIKDLLAKARGES
jgi:hypothetical protein